MRNRAWLFAFAVSCLFHAVLFWALGSDALRGSTLVWERSASTVVHVVMMPQSNIVPRENVRGSEPKHFSQVPGAVLPASGSSPVVADHQRDANQSAAEPLPSDADPKVGGLLLESHYFSPEELTVKPLFLSDGGSSGPTYIPDILPLPVLVQILINEQGDVDKVVLGDNFLSEVAQKYIMSSFAAMKFSPGMIGSIPVKSHLSIVVKLDPTVPVN